MRLAWKEPSGAAKPGALTDLGGAATQYVALRRILAVAPPTAAAGASAFASEAPPGTAVCGHPTEAWWMKTVRKEAAVSPALQGAQFLLDSMSAPAPKR